MGLSAGTGMRGGWKCHLGSRNLNKLGVDGIWDKQGDTMKGGGAGGRDDGGRGKGHRHSRGGSRGITWEAGGICIAGGQKGGRQEQGEQLGVPSFHT